MNSDELIYVYCISDSIPILEKITWQNGLKYLIFQDYYIITKYVSADEFSEENLKKNFSNMPWVETHAREHIRIISIITKNNTVIPFKFGTIYNSEDSLKKFINDHSSSIRKNLEKVHGKEEWSAKIYYNSGILKSNISGLSEEIRKLEQKIAEGSPGKAYLLEKKKNDIMQQEIEKIINIYGQKCYDKLKEKSELNQINNLLPRELSGKKEEMILNVAYLVKKQNVHDFINTAILLKNEYKNLGFKIEYTGPWPPFNFINLYEQDAEQHNK